MTEYIKTLKRNEKGFGLLIESDAGYIDPADEKNQKVIKEAFETANNTDSSNYGKAGIPLILHAVLQKADVLNLNNRVYGRDILFKQIEVYKQLIKDRTSGSENDHPESAQISIAGISNRIIDIWIEGSTVLGKILVYVSLGFVKYGVLSCPGDQIALLLSYNHKVGVSSRSIGSVTTRNSIDYVEDDLELICFDFVASPSTKGAWTAVDKSELQQYVENKQVKKPILENKVKDFLGLMND